MVQPQLLPVAVAAVGAGEAAAAKDSFLDIELIAAKHKKVGAIKVVRELLSWP